MKLRIIPFRLEHLESWRTGDEIYDSYFISYIINSRDHDSMLSGYLDDQLIGVGGLDIMWTDEQGRNYYDAWLKIMYESIPEDKRYACARRILNAFRYLKLQASKVKRIQAIVEDKFDRGNCLVELLGFKKEGTMRCYPPNGNDANIYGMVFE